MNNIPLEELRNMETTLIDTKNKSLELLTYCTTIFRCCKLHISYIMNISRIVGNLSSKKKLVSG